MSDNVTRIALTPGEPAGIGPDLAVMLAQQDHGADIVAICDPALLQARAGQLGLPLELEAFDPSETPRPAPAGSLRILPVELAAPARCGLLDSANAGYVLKTLDAAIEGCLSGTFAALVTGPLHKGIINEAGIPFTGHTEYLAAATGGSDVVMLLAAGELRVALVTTHLPLAGVSRAITPERIRRVARTLHAGLQQRLGIASPRILVCGLNPHAGEDGHLGREEIDIIIPALDELRAEGLALQGPLPADTAFTPPMIAASDAILAMYHDQGLPVLKHAGFGHAVNITLGLPIIRTSVDHGTALDLAGTGKASTGSLEAALAAAIAMATHRA